MRELGKRIGRVRIGLLALMFFAPEHPDILHAMRRFIAIFLLVLLPLQTVWAAVAPYCLHEAEQKQSQHLGHHQHEQHADAAGVEQGDSAKEQGEMGTASAMTDHDHHCCAGVSLLSAKVQLFGPRSQPEEVPSLLATYASYDANRIERPDWAVSL